MPVKKAAAAVKKATLKKGQEQMKVDGKTLLLTNQQKLYWPKEKITKGDMIAYYNVIYPYIIPYLKDRPQSLRRNPNGILDEGFFHKDAGDSAPSWVKSKKLFSESANKDIDYIICNDKPTLLYLNNLGCIELNPWNSRLGKLDNPDYLIIDIDPSEKNSFEQVIDVANVVKEVIDKIGIIGYCKTSGATGLHIYIPLAAKYNYEQVRYFAELIAKLTEEQIPELATTERSLNKRNGRIYIDYLQNKKGQTLACAYCLRPKAGATASAPLDWKEVKKGLEPIQFNIKTLLLRVKKKGDLFKPVLGKGIDMDKAIKKIETGK